VVFEDLSYRDIGTHEVVAERGQEPRERGIRLGVDERLARLRVLQLDDSVVDLVARAELELPGHCRVGVHDLLEPRGDGDRCTAGEFQEARDGTVGPEEDSLQGGEGPRVAFELVAQQEFLHV